MSMDSKMTTPKKPVVRRNRKGNDSSKKQFKDLLLGTSVRKAPLLNDPSCEPLEDLLPLEKGKTLLILRQFHEKKQLSPPLRNLEKPRRVAAPKEMLALRPRIRVDSDSGCQSARSDTSESSSLELACKKQLLHLRTDNGVPVKQCSKQSTKPAKPIASPFSCIDGQRYSPVNPQYSLFGHSRSPKRETSTLEKMFFDMGTGDHGKHLPPIQSQRSADYNWNPSYTNVNSTCNFQRYGEVFKTQHRAQLDRCTDPVPERNKGYNGSVSSIANSANTVASVQHEPQLDSDTSSKHLSILARRGRGALPDLSILPPSANIQHAPLSPRCFGPCSPLFGPFLGLENSSTGEDSYIEKLTAGVVDFALAESPRSWQY